MKKQANLTALTQNAVAQSKPGRVPDCTKVAEAVISFRRILALAATLTDSDGVTVALIEHEARLGLTAAENLSEPAIVV